MEMPQMSGYTSAGRAPVAEMSRRMSEAFRAEVVWAHADLAPGRTISYALDSGIPSIYTECPASRCASPAETDVYQRGVRNVMRAVGMMHGDLEGEPSRYYLSGSGDTDANSLIRATTNGFFVPQRELLDWVEVGDLLGVIYHLSGDVLEEIRAPSAGYIGLRRLLPTTHTGERLFMMAEKHQWATTTSATR